MGPGDTARRVQDRAPGGVGGSGGARGRTSPGHRHPVAADPVRDHHARCRAPDHGPGFRAGPAHRRDSGRAPGRRPCRPQTPSCLVLAARRRQHRLCLRSIRRARRRHSSTFMSPRSSDHICRPDQRPWAGPGNSRSFSPNAPADGVLCCSSHPGGEPRGVLLRRGCSCRRAARSRSGRAAEVPHRVDRPAQGPRPRGNDVGTVSGLRHDRRRHGDSAGRRGHGDRRLRGQAGNRADLAAVSGPRSSGRDRGPRDGHGRCWRAGHLRGDWRWPRTDRPRWQVDRPGPSRRRIWAGRNSGSVRGGHRLRHRPRRP